tara:strand:+ start:1259 stop:1507 length:249 start_codon:yes stop_codon:yes gene_type:complete
MTIDNKLLQYILHKCGTTINHLSKSTGINYNYLYSIEYANRKFLDEELDLLREYLKKNTTLSERYIHMRIYKIKKRNMNNKK